MPPNKSLQLTSVADLTPFIGSGKLVALNVGPDLQLYAVIALQAPDRRIETPTDPGFATAIPNEMRSYRMVALHKGNVTLDVRIHDQPFSIHDIQPLPHDELLLVCCRSSYRGPDDYDKNGRIYSHNGQLVREILLGDGIQRIQTTSTGMIWTSFFDEGIFGNYGWEEPVGSSGLVAWDAHGNKHYEFEPTDGLEAISDCYALNVASDSSTWLYYYTEFPLVHLRDQQIQAHWDVPVSGSGAFAIADGWALFAGGYDEPDDYRLFQLGHHGSISEVAKLNFFDESKQLLSADLVFGRSDALYIVQNAQVYRCNIPVAAAAT
jgi:hypothetical protein